MRKVAWTLPLGFFEVIKLFKFQYSWRKNRYRILIDVKKRPLLPNSEEFEPIIFLKKLGVGIVPADVALMMSSVEALFCQICRTLI